jgi:hypothetical protein
MREAFKIGWPAQQPMLELLVPASGLDVGAARARAFRDFLDSPGADVLVAVERVAALASEASGKLRNAVDEVFAG